MANTKKQEKEEIDLTSIKEELTDYINIQIKKNYTEEVEKANQRLIKEKNKKIFSRNIVIIILLFIIVFLLNLLYNNQYFDQYFNQESNIVETNTKNQSISTEETEEKTLNELIDEYSYLIDNIKISENSKYLNDYYNGNLTNELKNYLTLNSINISNLSVEDDYTIIDEEIFSEAYNKLFSDSYIGTTFEYNNTKIKYIEKLKSYVTDKVIKEEPTNIKKEIQNIEVNDNEIIITTIEAIVKDNKVYNISTLEEITTYKDYTFTKYQDKLNTMTYIFNKNKLESIK